MNYIKTVTPCGNYQLHLEMESGSLVTADFSGKLDTIKFAELADKAFFSTAATDGNYVIWGSGRLRLTIHEVMEVVLLG